MNTKDLQALEEAARLIVSILERWHVAQEGKEERVRDIRSRLQFVQDVGEPAGSSPGGELAPVAFSEKKEKPANGRGSSGVLKFTDKEIIKMPKNFRHHFLVGKIVAHVQKKSNGVYEIRCQINKQPIYASSKLLETAKEKFIDALGGIEVARFGNIPAVVASNKNQIKLGEYMLQWLEHVKKPAVKAKTYKEYVRLFHSDIEPVFGNIPITSIKHFKLQAFLNTYKEQEKHRTAQKLYQLLAPYSMPLLLTI